MQVMVTARPGTSLHITLIKDLYSLFLADSSMGLY